MTRYAAKVDANQSKIVDALRKAGASVELTHAVAGGFPDLVVGYRGQTFLIEVKAPNGKLNDVQRTWHALWLGQVAIANDTMGALQIIGAVKGETT